MQLAIGNWRLALAIGRWRLATDFGCTYSRYIPVSFPKSPFSLLRSSVSLYVFQS